MFRPKKGPVFSFERISKKLLNDRENIQKVKHLRSIIDNLTHSELKKFFQEHYSFIFNAFYDVFMNVQTELQQKANISHYKELQNILGVFEKILILLPELINQRWQSYCISNIIKMLIHKNNILKIRLQGLQLFVIWFQILGNNATERCYDIFISIVPIFESLIRKKIYPDLKSEISPGISPLETLVNEIEIKPVLTQNIDKEIEVEDEDRHLLRYLLRFIVTESSKIIWESKSEEKRLQSQTFLFEKFKEYFLPVIFPRCSSDYTIEKNKSMKLVISEFLDSYSPVLTKYPIDSDKICLYQEEIIRWLAELVNTEHPKFSPTSVDQNPPRPPELQEDNKRDTSNFNKSSSSQNKSLSMENCFLKFDKDEYKIDSAMLEQMHVIFFHNEENVNIINQIFQHAFYLPLQGFKAHLSVIHVYKSWLFSKYYKHPPFMHDGDVPISMKIEDVTNPNDSINDENKKVNISVTMQHVIFTNVGAVFLSKYRHDSITIKSSPNKKQQSNVKQIHSDLIKKAIQFIYRESVFHISNLEFEHLMNVLLDISFKVLSCYSPNNRPDNHWISDDLTIGQFFQTLNVLLLKSNLVSYISDEIWERYMKVYSSLTDWTSMINEWEKSLNLLLKILGKLLYNVDITNLPLETKERRGRKNKKGATIKSVKKLSNEENRIDIITERLAQNSNQNLLKHNTMTDIFAQPIGGSTFIESLHPNAEDITTNSNEQRNNINTRMEIKESILCESNRNTFSESNEMDIGRSFCSSHEESSSYLSAEDSSSPHCKDKNIETNIGVSSDSEYINTLPSSGGDTSMEGNSSSDIHIKALSKDESEDLNIDADDESEGDMEDKNRYVVDSKTATLTRDESDIDIASPMYIFTTHDNLNDNSRTPTKYQSRRKHQMTKRVDRNSINIEENIVNAISDPQVLPQQVFTSTNLNDHHVSLGGTTVGWNQESIVLMWKRYIGLLGNITQIKNEKNLIMIFNIFLKLTNSFLQMRENMCIPIGNEKTPSPPVYIPPIEYIVPWIFQALQTEVLCDEAKLIALRILCKITVRKLDIEPCMDHLAQFYKVIHSIIQSDNENFIYPLISGLGSHFFSMPLAGSEIVILDIIKGCEKVLEISNKPSKSIEIPKLEAISLLSSILRLQDLRLNLKVFDPSSKQINIIESGAYKGKIVQLLINSAKQEPMLSPRILSIICLSKHCYCELTSANSLNSDINDVHQCILLLLSLLRFDNLEIATIACDMIRFLVNSCSQMQEKLPLIPEIIIQVLSWTINQSWSKFWNHINSSHKKFLTTAIFSLLDWTMHLPLSQLLESNDLHSKGLIFLAFSALENVLKDYEIYTTVKSSNFKPSESEKKSLQEVRQNSNTLPNLSKQGNYNGLSNDPLIEYTYLFEVKPVLNATELDSNPDPKLNESIKLAARMALCHLINNLGQFPKNNVLGGLSSCVQENHDFHVVKVKSKSETTTEGVVYDDLCPEVFNTNDLQLFVVNGSMLISFIGLSSKPPKPSNQSAPGGPPTPRQMTDSVFQESEVRLIIRDLCGKYCWDVTFIHKYDNNITIPKFQEEQENMPPSPPPRRTLPSNISNDKSFNLKTTKSEKVVTDYVDTLLMDLTQMNPEIFRHQFPKTTVTDISPTSFEYIAKRQIFEQNNIENNLFDNHHCLKISHPKLMEKKLRTSVPYENPPESIVPKSRFYFCRQILTQLGFLSWKRRSSIDLIQKSNINIHLKTIDQRRGRETHKIAVLYVGWGQEDKESVLGNTTGSLEFNTFISGLGWSVNLEHHKGFMGGLEASGRNGSFAPYFANSTVEIMFHVSTWMPSEKAEDKQNKFKHLGNDEVMVIWSENYRDFRSHITKTEFGDVMIIIYPLRNGYFGITINAKIDNKLFGPLFDGAIVEEKDLAVLVRATAINAGRKIRECKQHYQDFFVERANYLEKAIKKFCEPMTFEDFAENIYGIPTTKEDSVQTNSSTEMSPITNPSENKNLAFTATDLTSSLSNVDGSTKGPHRHSSSPKTNFFSPVDRSHNSFEDSTMTRKQSKSHKLMK